MPMNWVGNVLAISCNLPPDMRPVAHHLLPIDDDLWAVLQKINVAYRTKFFRWTNMHGIKDVEPGVKIWNYKAFVRYVGIQVNDFFGHGKLIGGLNIDR